MRRLVSDLLLLARADAGRPGARRPSDLVAIAREAVAEVRAVSYGHTFMIEERGPVMIDCNPDDMHRLVLNLTENAVRHTPPDSDVRISVLATADGATARGHRQRARPAAGGRRPDLLPLRARRRPRRPRARRRAPGSASRSSRRSRPRTAARSRPARQTAAAPGSRSSSRPPSGSESRTRRPPQPRLGPPGEPLAIVYRRSSESFEDETPSAAGPPDTTSGGRHWPGFLSQSARRVSPSLTTRRALLLRSRVCELGSRGG